MKEFWLGTRNFKNLYGLIQNYRLDFNTFSNRWKGASATVVPHEGYSVWGAMWEINSEHLESLDKYVLLHIVELSITIFLFFLSQEGVSQKVYFPLEMEVEMPDGKTKTCRVYQQCDQPEAFTKLQHLPHDRKPSKAYLDVILAGSEESDLPAEYRNVLAKIPHNGYSGNIEIKLEL